jgi:hypothetical protein
MVDADPELETLCRAGSLPFDARDDAAAGETLDALLEVRDIGAVAPRTARISGEPAQIGTSRWRMQRSAQR